MSSRRPYSIRTRIKTRIVKSGERFMIYLGDHIPLKQGLRQPSPVSLVAFRCVTRRPYSIKTRIKTSCPYRFPTAHYPRRPYSITTRIKTPRWYRLRAPSCLLADHIPLKQGFEIGGRSSAPSAPSDLSPQAKASPNTGISILYIRKK